MDQSDSERSINGIDAGSARPGAGRVQIRNAYHLVPNLFTVSPARMRFNGKPCSSVTHRCESRNSGKGGIVWQAECGNSGSRQRSCGAASRRAMRGLYRPCQSPTHGAGGDHEEWRWRSPTAMFEQQQLSSTQDKRNEVRALLREQRQDKTRCSRCVAGDGTGPARTQVEDQRP